MTVEFDGVLIGLKISKLRTNLNMSAKELAAKSGLSASHINYIERGLGAVPPLDTLYNIATALNTSLDRILEDNLRIYNSIEVKNKTDKEILNAFYALPVHKKECVINILRSYGILRELVTSPSDQEKLVEIDLPEKMKSSTYLQELMLELAELSDNQQRYILDVIRPMISNIERLIKNEGSSNV